MPPNFAHNSRMSNPILFVTHYTGLGGGETATLRLAERLPDDMPAHLMVPAEGAFSAAWRAMGGHVHIIPFRGATTAFVPPVWAHFPARYKIERLIRTEGIAAVHSDYHALPFALPAAASVGVPLVWTVMGWWFQPRRWQRAFFRRPAMTFAHSIAIRDGFLGVPPFMPPSGVTVLYPAVETERYARHRTDGARIRAELGIAADAPVVVMAGRFQDVKGHDIFVRAAWSIQRRIPETRFIIAGGNAQTPADRLFQQNVTHMIQKEIYSAHKFHLIGHRDDLPDVLAAADVVVCPSDFESFGVVNIEAMAAGKPVVSTNHGGPAEVVVDGVTGYLVPPRDPAAIIDRVLELLYSQNLRRSMGTAGRLRVGQHFDIDTNAATFTAALRTLITEKDST
jgi:glycosyltransferase involved in cell wall biosynthesis